MAIARARTVKKKRGISGSVARASASMKAIPRTRAKTTAMVPGVLPPVSADASNPKTRAVRPPVPSSAPGTSRRAGRVAGRFSEISRGVKASAVAAMGRLMKNIQRQEARSASAPDRTRPVVPPKAARPP
ncbi:hypothetical protein GCM10010191_49230 [Actinomadura vinacea]|uniref:Uncharacterized protein n=1 Tax=Actinomadura vinacea TaxID=115336 RepID=A0ABP5WM45_9ACTN